MQTSIPKFTSFRPKQPAETLTVTRSEGQSQNKPVRQARNLDHVHDHDRRPHVSLQRHKPRDQEWKGPSNQNPVRYSQNESSDVYFIDRMGDTGIQAYGTNNKSGIPIYRSASADYPLGGSNDEVLRQPKPGLLSALTREDKAKLQGSGRLIRATKLDALAKGGAAQLPDFLPLNHARKRKRSPPVTDPEDVSLVALAQKTPPFATDSELSDSKSNTENIDVGSDIRQENVRLSNLVKAEPKNAKAWSEYVEFQEIWGNQDRPTYRDSTADERRSIAEVKLSIYRKALEAVGKQSRDYEFLLLRMMQETEKILETTRLIAKWKEVTQKNRDCHRLGLEYINFTQSASGYFRYEECRAIYQERFEVLTLSRKSACHSSFDQDNYLDHIYVILRLTVFMRECGYHEHAVALWQALLELNFFKPQAVISDWQSALEDFWETEQPRLGETRSRGWCGASRESVPEPNGDEGWPDTEENLDDTFAYWAQEEQNRMRRSRQPGHATDDTNEEDPYHVVLFSDIKPFLVSIDNEEAKIILLDAFLCFCRLPPLPGNLRTIQTRQWWHDSFLRNDCESTKSLSCNEARASASDISNSKHFQSNASGRAVLDPISSTVSSNSCLATMKQLTSTSETLFADSADLFASFDHDDEIGNPSRWSVDLQFVSNILDNLVTKLPRCEELAQYHLALEMHLCPLRARKKAKALLKERSSSLQLYNAYALIEARSGKADAADRVFSTAIQMSTTLKPEDRGDVILLCRSWVWEALRVGDTTVALQRLTLIGNDTLGEKPVGDGKTMLDLNQTEQVLLAGMDTALSKGRHNNAVLFCECLALLTYLSSSNDITATLSVFSAQSALLALRIESSSMAQTLYSKANQHHSRTTTLQPDPALEHLHQAQAQLIAHHIATHLPYSPSEILSALADSIKLFPNNSIFLNLHASTTSTIDRIRQIMHNSTAHLPEPDTVVAWVSSIRTEIQRAAHPGSTAHSVRSVFERALASKSCKHSAAVWEMYLVFEHERGELSRAKIVFFRGLRMLPWVKGFAMLAFTLLRGVMEGEELKGVWGFMNEREMRLHVDLEKMLRVKGAG